MASARQYSLQVGTYCQFLTCRYKTLSYRIIIHPTTRRHIPEPFTQIHGVISQNHSPNHKTSYPRTTHRRHGVISQNHSPNHTVSHHRTTHPNTASYLKHSPKDMSYPRTIHLSTRRHIPEPLTQPHGVTPEPLIVHGVISQKHSPKYTASDPRTTHPTTRHHNPEPLSEQGVILEPFTQPHGVISQNHSPNSSTLKA